MIVELIGAPDGGCKWTAKPASRAEKEALMDALQSGQFHTGKELAAHLGWAPAKVSRWKRELILNKAITERAWTDCLKRDDDDGGADF
jgi:hypothetical protein